jgi:CDP-paratose 2-epimerase
MPITIYGDGKQVRDVLHVADLMDAYDLAIGKTEQAAGEVFNIGGGPENTLSVWQEFRPLLQDLIGGPIKANSRDWRAGDQRVYVSDIRKAERILGWKPRIDVERGVQELGKWVKEHIHLFST